MDVFLIKALQLILTLSILVVFHEFGHFVFARIFGVRVSKFYIFSFPIGREFVLFKWKPKKYKKWFSYNYEKEENKKDDDTPEKNTIKVQVDKDNKEIPSATDVLKTTEAASEETKGTSDKKEEEKDKLLKEDSKEAGKKSFWGETEYGIGWLPVAGYCQMEGMLDESMDEEQLQKPVEDWEFRAKPAWQRLLIMIAGVLFNFLLAILIYAGIVYVTGEKYVPFEEAKLGMAYSGEAKKIGFKDGDIPLYADGEKLENPAEARMKMIQASSVKVLRDGKDTVEIKIPEKFIFALDNEAKSDTANIMFMTYRLPTRITQVMPGESASKAGLEVGDEIIAIDSIATPSLDSFMSTLQNHENQTINLMVVRNSKNSSDTLNIPVSLSENSKMGVGLEIDPSAFYKAKEIKYTLLSSVPKGIQMGTDKMTSYASSMKLVFTKEGAKSVGGFGSLGAIFPEKWDWIAFWNIVAFISVALAFMNILPIPILDGGHVLFLIYEVIRGKPVPLKVQKVLLNIGMFLLLALLVYANAMDIVRLIIN